MTCKKFTKLSKNAEFIVSITTESVSFLAINISNEKTQLSPISHISISLESSMFR